MRFSTNFRPVLLPIVIASIAAIAGASCSPTALPDRTNPSTAPQTDATAPKTTLGADPTEITLSEFQAIQQGMTLEQVRAIIGSDGKITSSSDSSDPKYAMASYQWYGGKYGNAIIGFQGTPLKVANTVQFGLED